MITKEYKNFDKGIIDVIEQQSIPVGAASKSSNFRTRGDKIELAGGKVTLGTIINATDEILGLHTAVRRDGFEFLIFKRGKKLFVYDEATDTATESGTDIFTDGEFDEMSFVNIDTQAGAQVFMSSPNTGIFKLMAANPLNPVSMQSTDYRGYIFGSQNRLFLVQRKGTNNAKDDTGVYTSYIDEENYTTETAENIGTGNGSAVTFTDTLVFKAGGSKRTCFGIAVTDGVESFVDDFNGNLIGSAGGTGTINYATGAISVTFNVAPLNTVAITCTYQWEDSTNGGVADFTFTSPTRNAGEGDVFRQDSGGGKAQRVCHYNGHEFCFHEKKTWDLQLTSDDTNASNLPYRDQVGIPHWRAADASGEGIYYIDATDPLKPVVRLLTLNGQATEIVPRSISKLKSLEGFTFDEGWLKVIGDSYVIWAGKSLNATKNDTLFVYDKQWKSIDQMPLYSTCATVLNGELVLGDSLSPNIYMAFNGYDDDGVMVNGSWESNLWDQDYDDNLKKCKNGSIEGEIQKNQIANFYIDTDRGGWVFVDQIRGDGNYVDTTQSISVGSRVVGKGTVGGGLPKIAPINAYHYIKPIIFRTDKYQEIKWKVEIAVDDDGNEGIGYFSVTKVKFHDIRIKDSKLPSKYRA